MKKKIKIMIASAAALGTVAVAGISYAAYARNNDVAATGTTESFRPVSVSGEWLGGPDSSGLLPGEAGDVRIVVSVSGQNTVGAKVTSITAQPITGGSITADLSAEQKDQCAKLLTPAKYTPDLVLAKGAANVQIRLKNAVKFYEKATEACEGIQFVTKWTVTFAPSRITSGLTGSGARVEVSPAPTGPLSPVNG